MAQYDLTELADRIAAAGGDPTQLLQAHERIMRLGDAYVACNRQAQYAAYDLVTAWERAAATKAAEEKKAQDRQAAAAEMLNKVKAGLTLFAKDPQTGWIIVGPTAALTPGAQVEVTKANGETKTVRVASVIASFSKAGVDYSTARFADLPRVVNTLSRSAAPTRGCCAECGTYSTHLTVVADSSGVSGACCPRCARLDSVERSFG